MKSASRVSRLGLLTVTALAGTAGLFYAGAGRADPAGAPAAQPAGTQVAQASSPAPPAAKPAAPIPKPEEITVTAGRNGAANVQKVPIAVTVVRPETIERFGGTGLADYTETVPSLSMQDDGPGINKINMRGVVTSGLDYTDVQDRPTVAVYLDETPISLQAQNPDLKVFDLSRIEVLRGPQGTLYGAGAMSGTIRLITQKPDPNAYFGTLEEVVSGTDGGYGGGNYSLRAMGNIPIVSDKAAVRVVLYRGDDSGFIRNIGLNKNDPDDITNQARVALRLKPTDNLIIDASFTYENLRAATYDAYAGLPAYQTKTLEPEYTTDNLAIYNLTETYDLGFATATNSTSYLMRRNGDYAANEYGVNAFLYFGLPPLQPALDVVRNKTSDIMDEFRLASTGDGPVSWNGGVFYDKFTRDFFQDQPAHDFDSYWAGIVDYPGYSSTDDGAFGPNDDFSGIQDVNENQVAVFGQATYHITDKLNLTAGLRFFDWHQNFNLYFGGVFGASPTAAGGVNGTPEQETGKAAASGTTPRFALDYHLTPDIMLFIEAAKGFRYGGVNQPVPESICGPYLAQIGLKEAPLQFGPDKLWSYSIGEKGTFLQDRLTANLTGFLIDWNDVQTTRDLACDYYFIENKGEIQSKGVELETSAKLTQHLSVTANASYTDSATDGPIANLNAASGAPAPYTPKYIASLSANYVVPLEMSSLNFGVEYNYRSFESTTFNPADFTYRTIPELHRLNAEITYRVQNWQIGLFANNIGSFAKIVNANAFIPASQQPGDTIFYTRPMTIGLRVKTSF